MNDIKMYKSRSSLLGGENLISSLECTCSLSFIDTHTYMKGCAKSEFIFLTNSSHYVDHLKSKHAFAKTS